MAITVLAPGNNTLTADSDSALIGRDATCAISLPDETNLNPVHAEIKKFAGRWLIESQGDWLIQVGAESPGRKCWLKPGDVIRLTQSGPELIFEPVIAESKAETKSSAPPPPPPPKVPADQDEDIPSETQHTERRGPPPLPSPVADSTKRATPPPLPPPKPAAQADEQPSETKPIKSGGPPPLPSKAAPSKAEVGKKKPPPLPSKVIVYRVRANKGIG